MARQNWKFPRFLFLLFLLGFSLFFFRQPILTHIAGYLIISDDLEKADGIAVLSGDIPSRCQKAADLFFQGWASRILITKGRYPDMMAAALNRYGILELESSEKCRAVLKFCKVPEDVIEVLDGYNESTADEAEKLRRYLLDRGMTRLIVVTSNFHTRRSRLLFGRFFAGTGVQVTVQAAPANFTFDPEAWWTRRHDSRILLLEYQKLAFYALRYW